MKKVMNFLFAVWTALLLGVNVQAQQIDFHEPVKVFKSRTIASVVRTADITGDGIKDLVVGGYDTLYLLKGNGDGSFTNTWKAKIGMFYDCVIADFTNDGKMDLVFPNNSYDMGLLINDGAGGFLTLKKYHLGGGSRDLAVADFDQDGYLDVVAPTIHELDPHYKYIAVFINNKNGTLKNRVLYNVPPRPYGTPESISGFYVNALDMNDDGYPDVVQPYQAKDSLAVYYNKGDGTFNDAVRLAIPSRVTKTGVKDLDHDGKEDLILLGQKQPTVINPDYTFGFYLQKADDADENIIRTYPNPETGQLFGANLMEDINLDGEYDLTLNPKCCLDEVDFTSTDSLVIYLNQGGLNFNVSVPSYSTRIYGGVESFISADFNGDNLPDYSYMSADSCAYVILQKSTVTSIGSPSTKNQNFLLYPNPSRGILNLRPTSEVTLDIKSVSVFDLMGKQVLKEEVDNTSDEVKLELDFLRSGMYLLKVEYGNGLNNTQSFVLE